MSLNPESEGSGLVSGSPPAPKPVSTSSVSPPEPGQIEGSSALADVAVEEAFPSLEGGGKQFPPPSVEEPEPEDHEAPETGKMSFLEHLEELRRRIFYSLIAIAVGFLLCWTFADEIYAGLARPLTQVLRELKMEDHLVYTNPVAPFNLYVHLALLAGLFAASPFLLWQVWKFISPGLYRHEKKYALPFILLGSLLFISGGAFAYAIAFPAALRFLLNFGHQFRPMITVNEYFSLAMTIILGMALVFELPILILFLTLLRLMTPGFLFRNFRYAVLVIFIVAAVITPTPDVPTMMLFATPLIGLYLFGIGLSYLVLRLRKRSED